MENLILNCLMANFFGTGNQVVPQGGSNAPQEGQDLFLALFSQKMMNGILGMALPELAKDTSADAGQAGGKGQGNVAEGVPHDNPAISILVSALTEMIAGPIAPQPPQQDLSTVTEFLHNILDVLSGGDEVELTGKAPVETGNDAGRADPAGDAGQKGLDNAAANSFVGSLAVFLTALNAMARKDTETAGQDAGEPKSPQLEIRPPEPLEIRGNSELKPVNPANGPAHDAGVFAAGQGEVQEKPAGTPAFLVEVTRSAKEAKIVDVSMQDVQKRPPSPAVVMLDEKKAENAPDRPDTPVKEKVDVDRIIIRVTEKEDPDVKNDTGEKPANENNLSLNGNSHQGSEQHKPAIHAAAKNDFGAMMIDKIEKITEQYAGKNLGMDMTVRLKIDDSETILVGMRNEGTSVTVEVKTANNNTMNFIQSQKNDLVRNLEDKHIMTTIHVDIDQDAQRRHEQGRHRERGEDAAEQAEDFGNFFEALA